jgi:hypothetical protein
VQVFSVVEALSGGGDAWSEPSAFLPPFAGSTSGWAGSAAELRARRLPEGGGDVDTLWDVGVLGEDVAGEEYPEFYCPGDILHVVGTPWGKIGVNICADNYENSLCIGSSLARMGAGLILSPSSWTVDYSVSEDSNPYNEKWLKPYSALANTYGLIIAGATSVGYIVGGPYEGKKMVGCSLAVGPSGILSQGLFNEFSTDIEWVSIEIPIASKVGTDLGKFN